MSIKYIITIKICNKFSFLLFFSIVLFITACSSGTTQNIIADGTASQSDYFVIWAHSDIQPRNESEKIYYDTAISDINNNFTYVNLALVAGDIIHWSESANIFDWYNSMKKKTSIKYWYEIAGNHDQKDFKNYQKYINLPLHYSVQTGNLLILCLSDENLRAETEISDTAFNWWEEMVISNQDKIIITMTHASLKQSWLMGTVIPSRNIRNSERFAKVLKNYKVDLWLCGHMHLLHSLKGSMRIADNLNNTLFINVSTIRANKLKDVESFLFYLKKDSDQLLIRSRNHSKQSFYDYYSRSFRLSHKFKWNNENPVITKMTSSSSVKAAKAE
ncbi:MAG: metallophosphoesterase [Spirochaetes bacterium]|nr:metallophosphoesterase [Spirochaetota bacterium]